MPDKDQDKAQQKSGNAHNVIDEVIKEENELDVGDFLSYLTSFAWVSEVGEDRKVR